MGPLGWVMALLISGDTWTDPNQGRNQVTGLGHALRVGTLAEQSGGSREGIAVAVLHDAARPLSEIYHGEVMAEILRGRVDDRWCQALHYHGMFQADLAHGTHNAQQLCGRPWWGHASTLAAWDAAGFDPEMEPYPLEHFLPALMAVLA